MGIYAAMVPVKLPGLNDYIRACRGNKYRANALKNNVERTIAFYLRPLPVFKGPVRIRFTWYEKDRRRDLDNVAFGKKFILDALVKDGHLPDDNRRYVVAFSDDFKMADACGVFVEITEIK